MKAKRAAEVEGRVALASIRTRNFNNNDSLDP